MFDRGINQGFAVGIRMERGSPLTMGSSESLAVRYFSLGQYLDDLVS